jgi:hypothetical protein
VPSVSRAGPGLFSIRKNRWQFPGHLIAVKLPGCYACVFRSSRRNHHALCGLPSMVPPPKTTSPAKDNRIEKLKDKVNKWIDDSRFSHPLASANLKHWRDGHGVTKVMSSASFLSQSFFLDHLRDVHRPKLLHGVRARLAGGVLKAGDPVELWWEDSVAASMWFRTDGQQGDRARRDPA